MKELLPIVDAWDAEGVGYGRAVLIRAFGSAPRREGATLLAADDGRLAGSVSGGCVEGACVEEILEARRSGLSAVIRYGITDEQAWDVGLACGSTIDVLIEPELRPEVAAAARAEGGTAVIILLPAGAPGPEDGRHEPARAVSERAVVVSMDGRADPGPPPADIAAAARAALDAGRSLTLAFGERQYFVESFAVAPRLIVFGAVQSAVPLVGFARELGFHTIVADARAAFVTAERFPAADELVVAWPDDVARQVGLGPRDSVVVMTHDPKLDEPAIVAAMRAACAYVGAIGSRRTQAARRQRLIAAGLTNSDLARLRAPHRAGPGRQGPGRDRALHTGRDSRRPPRPEWRPAQRAGGYGADAGRARRSGLTGTAAALVLAAGLGVRFGGNKLIAPLDGRPVLQHVLDTAAVAGLAQVVVVLGHQAEAVERAIRWRSELRVVNRSPEKGIASSVALGLRALQAAVPDAPGRALVLLGDQPGLELRHIEALLGTPRDAHRPIVVPRYVDGQPGNPVLLEHEVWSLAEQLEGDRGMVQLFAERPELVRFVDLSGDNPDVDTPADLAALQSRRSTSPIRP